MKEKNVEERCGEKPFSLRVPINKLDALKRYSVEINRSMTKIINELIDKYLEDNKIKF